MLLLLLLLVLLLLTISPLPLSLGTTLLLISYGFLLTLSVKWIFRVYITLFCFCFFEFKFQNHLSLMAGESTSLNPMRLSYLSSALLKNFRERDCELLSQMLSLLSHLSAKMRLLFTLSLSLLFVSVLFYGIYYTL